MIRSTDRFAAAAVAAMAIMVAACGSTSTGGPSTASGAPSTTTSGEAAGGVPGPLDEAVTVRFGVFPNITHAPGLVGAGGRWPALQAAAQRHDRGEAVQRGHRGRRGAVRRRDRHHLHRPQPGDQRLRQVQGRGRPRHLRLHLGRRLPRRAARDQRPPADLKGKKIATPSARQHPGRRAARLAEEPGPRHRHRGRRRRVDHARRRTPRRSSLPWRATIDGAWVPGAVGDPPDPGGRRQGPRRRARPVAGRQVRHHPPDRRARSSSTSTPTS